VTKDYRGGNQSYCSKGNAQELTTVISSRYETPVASDRPQRHCYCLYLRPPL